MKSFLYSLATLLASVVLSHALPFAFWKPASGGGGGGGGDGITSGLVGFWKLDEGAGTSVADISGNGLAGTITGADWATGYRNGALGFVRANDDHVAIAHNAALDVTTDWTFAAWIDPGTLGASLYCILGRDDDTLGRSYVFGVASSGSLCVQINGGQFIPGGSPMAVSGLSAGFHHVAVTMEGSTNLKFYIDGVQDGTTTAVGFGCNTSTAPLWIGGRSYAGNHDNFEGIIDAPKIAPFAFSPAQIATEAGVPPAP